MARLSRQLDSHNWIATTTGDGTIVFSDDGRTVNFDASTGSAAFIINPVVAWPGDAFEYSVLARNIDTGKSQWAEMIIDSPNGARKNEVRIDTKSLEYFTLRYEIPLAAATPRVINFAMGVDTPTDGSGEFTLPTINKVKGDNSFLYATYKIASTGGCTILETIKSFNTDNANIVWDAGNIRFVVTPTETTSTLFLIGATAFKPILSAIASSGNSVILPITWNIEGIGNDGSFNIQALNSLGQRMDLNANDPTRPDLFVTIKLEIK